MTTRRARGSGADGGCATGGVCTRLAAVLLLLLLGGRSRSAAEERGVLRRVPRGGGLSLGRRALERRRRASAPVAVAVAVAVVAPAGGRRRRARSTATAARESPAGFRAPRRAPPAPRRRRVLVLVLLVRATPRLRDGLPEFLLHAPHQLHRPAVRQEFRPETQALLSRRSIPIHILRAVPRVPVQVAPLLPEPTLHDVERDAVRVHLHVLTVAAARVRRGPHRPRAGECER